MGIPLFVNTDFTLVVTAVSAVTLAFGEHLGIETSGSPRSSVIRKEIGCPVTTLFTKTVMLCPVPILPILKAIKRRGRSNEVSCQRKEEMMYRMLYLMMGMVLGLLTVIAVSGSSSITVQDPVELSPQYYTVRFENDRVGVLEYRLKPGEKEVMHSHPAYLVYVLNDATLRITPPDGTTAEGSSTQGQVSWNESLSHAVENSGRTETHALLVELKPCNH